GQALVDEHAAAVGASQLRRGRVRRGSRLRRGLRGARCICFGRIGARLERTDRGGVGRGRGITHAATLSRKGGGVQLLHTGAERGVQGVPRHTAGIRGGVLGGLAGAACVLRGDPVIRGGQ